jgi:multidrug efflux pump subunit AcrB
MNASHPTSTPQHNDLLSKFVKAFLDSNLSIILIIAASLVGLAALLITPREEDPQIVVPLADVFVQAPGYDAKQVEQLVSTPLERMLSQIDGVEYVYSMSRDDQAIITVRFYVGQDRERSLVKLFKKLNENQDSVPAAVKAWVLKPVEIDDVPIVTFALSGAGDDSAQLRRIGEEMVERLASIKHVNRAYIVGGESRIVRVEVLPDRLQAFQLTLSDVQRAIRAANEVVPGDQIARNDAQLQIRTSAGLRYPEELNHLVVGVFQGLPVYIKDIAEVIDAANEPETYVRHGWGPAAEFPQHHGNPGTRLGDHGTPSFDDHSALTQTNDQTIQKTTRETQSSHSANHSSASRPSITIAISKQKGANAVSVSRSVIDAAEKLKREVLPGDVDLTITRNSGLTADEKVNELIEALGIAILIVVLLLTVGMGWREALIVAIAVPVVFGLTLFVNLLFGFTINRVTLFALILALGLLVDDPIVDVENIARHFHEKKKASRRIVLDAVAEIRPPLISATLAVIVSFLPMFFITGMMGPYMSPMALNVPVAMLMSMLVAFTITPWLTYHVLKKEFPHSDALSDAPEPHDPEPAVSGHAAYDPQAVKQTRLYRFFRPLMLPLLKNRFRALSFLAIIGALTVAAMGLGAMRLVPLKMLPFDNKNEFLILLDMPEGTTLERTSAVLQSIEDRIANEPEVIDWTSYVGCPSPIDFNGLVRHYYLREGTHQGEIRVNLVGKKNRSQQSHAITLRLRDDLTGLANSAGGILRLVELPPGPPVLASLVAEVYGPLERSYDELLQSAQTVKRRLEKEPGVVEVDDMMENETMRWTFVPDQEKAALVGVSVSDIANAVRTATVGESSGLLRVHEERHPLQIAVRLPRGLRQDPLELSQLAVRGVDGQLVRLTEIGKWMTDRVGQTIYHKNLQRVAYVTAETAGRPPADCIIDILADQTNQPHANSTPAIEQALATNEFGFVAQNDPRPLAGRSFFRNGSAVPWGLPPGVSAKFSGEGEWQITLDVFRDLGLAFGAAMILIYIILVAQTGSFLIPLIVMLAIPLTVLGVMPGFFMLNGLMAANVGGYADPVYFTATAMIGMIALSGIVTRDSIILVDFMEQAVRAGRPIFDAILESRVVRLRPILLTAGAAMLSAIPITLDPIFSGLGWSLIFGLIASTIFTLFVIPVTYWLFYAGRDLSKKDGLTD